MVVDLVERSRSGKGEERSRRRMSSTRTIKGVHEGIACDSCAGSARSYRELAPMSKGYTQVPSGEM